MAKTKWATVKSLENLGNDVHRIYCSSDEPLNHAAGNYVILRSTIPNSEKPEDVLKRAYSISSRPNHEDPLAFHFTIIDVGAMSAWLSNQSEGARLEFSGPWGKKFRALPEDHQECIHLSATGTGFSPIGAMALNRLHHGTSTVHVWWQTDFPYDRIALEQLAENPRFQVHQGPAVASEVPAQKDALYFFAGDGAVIQPLCLRLLEEGVAAESLRTEYFFNKPPRKR